MQERKLMELAEAAGTIAIVGHVRPDGDCVGSCLAVCNYITEQYPEKTVDVYLETPPAKFSYLEQFERICSDPETGKQYDLCICLDSGDRERLGKNVVYLDTAKTSICIDHHITNQGYAAANFVKADASATCELLYDFLDHSSMFHPTVMGASRSLMNVPFVTGNEELDKKFISACTGAGFVNIKGHRSVGGMRASIYNAMPYEGVKALVEFMQKFEKEN